MTFLGQTSESPGVSRSMGGYVSQCPFVFLLLLHVLPQLSGRCHGKPICLPSYVSLILYVSLWGWLSPCASDGIQGSVQTCRS